MPAFLIHGKIRAHHVGLLVNARRTLLQEHTGALHVVVLEVERTVCSTLRDRCPSTRHTATCLTNVGEVISRFRILQGRIHPNAVLLTTECTEEVRLAICINERVLTTRNLAVRVRKQIAVLVLRTKIEGVAAGVVAKLVRLRRVDRGNRAVTVLELHVDCDVIEAHSSSKGRGRTGFLQADETRKQRQRVGQVNFIIDVTVGDTIRFNQLGRVRDRSSSNRAGGLSLRLCGRLWGNNWVNKRRNQRHGESSGSNGSTAAAYNSTRQILLSHTKKSFP